LIKKCCYRPEYYTRVGLSITHNQVRQEVRKTIERVGGTLLENQPTPDKSIEEVQREQLKKLKVQLVKRKIINKK
jgi:DNA-damage-inducible protein D